MRIGLVTPAPEGSRTGNRVTAKRWAAILAALGHDVSVEQAWAGEDWDALVALHARKSHASILGYRDRHRQRPLIVALTGTDLYVDYVQNGSQVAESLEAADCLVALQPRARAALPPHLAERTRTIRQSSQAPADPLPVREGCFDVAVIGHLRPVKAPFDTAAAARLLPASSQIHVFHIGAAFDAEMERRARGEEASNPRYTWLGSLSHEETLRRLASCRLLSLTSRVEGGANVISEAVTCGVPVLATRIEGSVGMLGEDYPGLFDLGDVEQLARLLARAETDRPFYAELVAACAAQRDAFSAGREAESWRSLLASCMAGGPCAPQ